MVWKTKLTTLYKGTPRNIYYKSISSKKNLQILFNGCNEFYSVWKNRAHAFKGTIKVLQLVLIEKRPIQTG